MAEYNTIKTTLEGAKDLFSEPQNTSNWGMRFKKSPPALGKEPDNFWIGFQTADFPQEVITYLEGRVANFPMSWIGEVTRNGTMSATNIISERSEFLNYMTRWINLMSFVEKGKTTHKRVLTKDVEATVELYFLDEDGGKTIAMDLLFCKPEAMPGMSSTTEPSLLNGGFNLKFDNFYKYL